MIATDEQKGRHVGRKSFKPGHVQWRAHATFTGHRQCPKEDSNTIDDRRNYLNLTEYSHDDKTGIGRMVNQQLTKSKVAVSFITESNQFFFQYILPYLKEKDLI